MNECCVIALCAQSTNLASIFFPGVVKSAVCTMWPDNFARDGSGKSMELGGRGEIRDFSRYTNIDI
jgi:hypothetical protein